MLRTFRVIYLDKELTWIVKTTHLVQNSDNNKVFTKTYQQFNIVYRRINRGTSSVTNLGNRPKELSQEAVGVMASH